MIGPVGFLVFLLVILAPAIILYFVAKSRGESGAYALLGLFGWIGFVIGLVIVLTRPPRNSF